MDIYTGQRNLNSTFCLAFVGEVLGITCDAIMGIISFQGTILGNWYSIQPFNRLAIVVTVNPTF